MDEADILWGYGESLQQMFGQNVRELAPVEESGIALEIGALEPITLIGEKTDDALFDNFLVFF